jgi:hypothetical protein
MCSIREAVVCDEVFVSATSAAPISLGAVGAPSPNVALEVIDQISPIFHHPILDTRYNMLLQKYGMDLYSQV